MNVRRPLATVFLVGSSLLVASATHAQPVSPTITEERCKTCSTYHEPAPPPVQVVTGLRDVYTPLATFEPKGVLIQLRLQLAGRVESVTDFPIDRYGTNFETGAALSPQLRIGAVIDTRRVLKVLNLLLEYESDSPTGYWSSGREVAGYGMPNTNGNGPTPERMTWYQLRKAYARIAVGHYFHIGGGFMMNQWGMGLLANDGAHGWEPGNAQFVDQRGGDRVLRGFIGTGPITRAKLQITLAFDQVRGDDVILKTLGTDGEYHDDKAIQFIGAVQLGAGRPSGGGLFFVHRRQTTADNKDLNVSVVDLAGRFDRQLCPRLRLKLEAEVAVVAGETTLAPTPDHPEHQVLQVGAAARATLDAGRVGTVWDFLLASGDQNLDDRRSSSFKVDPNYPTGLLLFRYVTAAQSGRAPIVASDPNLVGYPNENLERIPTRGSASNTVALFPRIWGRPVAGLELYGGVLLAWSFVRNSDPFNTRLAGGALRNALNGDPGSFYGAEFDLGVRYRMMFHGTQLTVGAEGASLVPGSAFRTATGMNMDNVLGGRLMAEYRL